MKKCKIKFSDICAYMALLFSVVTIVLWICNVGGFTVVSLDSFVGVIVALLAIIVTFVTGWQIYNTIELKESLKKVNNFDSRLDYIENKLIQNDLSNKCGYNINLGYLFETQSKYDESFVAYHSAFSDAIRCQSIGLDTYLKQLKQLLPKFTEIKTEYLNMIEPDIKSIRSSSAYIQYFKEEYDAIITELYSKTENKKQ